MSHSHLAQTRSFVIMTHHLLDPLHQNHPKQPQEVGKYLGQWPHPKWSGPQHPDPGHLVGAPEAVDPRQCLDGIKDINTQGQWQSAYRPVTPRRWKSPAPVPVVHMRPPTLQQQLLGTRICCLDSETKDQTPAAWTSGCPTPVPVAHKRPLTQTQQLSGTRICCLDLEVKTAVAST
jgi:hypothetical protein